MVRVLVTNDDGIDSPGLAALARCAVDLGYDTVVAAPATEASGTGTSLMAATSDHRLAVVERVLPGLPDVPAYALAAHPALIALVACHGGLGPAPDVVLSGVNRGPNLGRAVLHSGTVGAALTGAVRGARALAVSLDVDVDDEREPHWAAAIQVVTGVLPELVAMPEGAVFTLNAPNVPAARVGPPRWARLSGYGRLQDKITRTEDGSIEVAAVAVDGVLEPDTDAALLAAGHATITPLRPVAEDTALLAGRAGQAVAIGGLA